MATQEQKAQFMEVLQTAQQAGIPHPEVVAAQWAAESGWGKKVTGKHNYWGVKAGNGDPNNNEKGTVSWTHENINGQNVKVKQKFRDYNSLAEALADRAAFTKRGGRYEKAGYFDATSPAEAAIALQKGGYATDPHYAKNLIDVMKSAGIDPYNGQHYDDSTTPSLNLAQHAEENTPSFPSQPNFQSNNPLVEFQNYFEQLNGTQGENAQSSIEPINYQQKYQKELAKAFGIEPSTKGMMPDYIGDLVRSIYDQT
ncbi:glucosaminidase domain-containing protein [Avibacterium sp. 21-586]|uniref:glycoside hydrolase family 73 protein n=1 Tax=Avibacterium sp. 21-586 TaxID=2911534 RepID=UPI002247C65B|nr:glucosaminidase domain-containing protein [Avibacterium sp. 21-586]MCW9710013.1 glucosaminidase domain-containing protein [Avibacterium sp. 21-586]